jgi:hypothetical protein
MKADTADPDMSLAGREHVISRCGKREGSGSAALSQADVVEEIGRVIGSMGDKPCLRKSPLCGRMWMVILRNISGWLCVGTV